MKITKTEKEVEIKKVVKQSVYNLELNEKELFFIRYIMRYIGGMTSGPRKVADDICRAIDVVKPEIFRTIEVGNDYCLHIDGSFSQIFLRDEWPMNFKDWHETQI